MAVVMPVKPRVFRNLSGTDTRAIFDSIARLCLNLSGPELLHRLETGDVEGLNEDDLAAAEMLLPRDAKVDPDIARKHRI